MKPTAHRKDTGLTRNDSSSQVPVKRTGGGKTTTHTAVLELEPLLDTDEDKILHLHDDTVGEEEQQVHTDRRR